jgi:ankyrin repeat protein
MTSTLTNRQLQHNKKAQIVAMNNLSLPWYCDQLYALISQKGNTVLHCAAGHGTWAIAELLLDKGAPINARNTVCENGSSVVASA